MPSEAWGIHRPQSAFPPSPLLLIDPLIVALTLGLSGLAHGIPWHGGTTAVAATAATLFLLFAARADLYRSWRTGGLRQEWRELLGVWTAVAMGLLLIGFATQTSEEFSRRVFASWGVGCPVALGGIRVAMRAGARWLRTRGRNLRRVAVVGAGEVADRVAQTLGDAPWMGFEIVGFFDGLGRARVDAGATPAAADTCGAPDLETLAQRGGVDFVYVAMAMGEESEVAGLVRRLATTPVSVYFVPDLAPFALLHSRWVPFGSLPTLSLFEQPLSAFERFAKRSLDLAVASAALALAAVPMLAIAAAIKLSSPGQVIFRQSRRGLDGCPIVVRKFRTMQAAPEGAGFRQARRNDPRVTPLGSFLRSSSLDELPQLFDVLRGDMSVVGPRPHPVPLDQEHRDVIDWYALRHRMKPGMTGWAQVNGFRGETDSLDKMEGRVRCDLEYIHNWSLWLDLKILALTPWKGLVGRHVY